MVGLATVFGAGGGTSSYREIEETDVIVLWGSNARETHPIFFQHVLKGIRNGARLFVVDPRRTSSAAWAKDDDWLGLHVGTDVALSNLPLASTLAKYCVSGFRSRLTFQLPCESVLVIAIFSAL